MTILVTGGTGYIGSHTVVELLNKGYDVTIVDNLSNSSKDVVNKIKQITNKDVKFINLSICSDVGIRQLFAVNHFDAVIHFAGLKAVGESIQKPLEYYYNNVYGTITLLKTMKEFNVNKLIFSSSATVYGIPKGVPIKESAEIGGTTNPYGSSKLMIEMILKDYAKSNPELGIVILRYFNPVGAHESGLIGENPIGIPNNLTPYIVQVASGKREKLHIFGNDYPTKDGTGIRDYIHITDLANGHISALEKIKNENGLFIYNLGTG
ncbi:MAG: UDP-glucose 4-epimerase GalE, partial [Clostridia bacterium]|nr:UDP-glucose 4-epimerase GalE [Clostridia bacterium]